MSLSQQSSTIAPALSSSLVVPPQDILGHDIYTAQRAHWDNTAAVVIMGTWDSEGRDGLGALKAGASCHQSLAHLTTGHA